MFLKGELAQKMTEGYIFSQKKQNYSPLIQGIGEANNRPCLFDP